MASTLLFYNPDGPYGCFSNFAPYPIIIQGVTYPTSEHYFQSQKFTEQKDREKIIKSATPGECFRLGRSLKSFRDDWEEVKIDVMYEGIKAKFTQHPGLKRQLLETQDYILVEHTARDSYWADGGNGSGKNRLGYLLMQLREEFRKK